MASSPPAQDPSATIRAGAPVLAMSSIRCRFAATLILGTRNVDLNGFSTTTRSPVLCQGFCNGYGAVSFLLDESNFPQHGLNQCGIGGAHAKGGPEGSLIASGSA